VVEESVVGGWVVAGGDGLVDWVGVGCDDVALVSDGEGVVGGGDGGGYECTDGDFVGNGPGVVGDVDGVVIVDVAEVGDTTDGEGKEESPFVVAVVGEVDVGWPAELVAVSGDVLGGVAGAAGDWIEDRSAMVEPPAGFLGAGAEFIEVGEVTGSDGTRLPEFVDCFNVVGPSQFSGRRDDDFGPKEQAETSPFSPWVVPMGGMCKRVVSPESLGNR
jgi:hypothetical protein